MTRNKRIALRLAIACLAGVGASELLYRSSSCREEVGRLMGRGELLAIVHGVGIYASDRDAHPEQDLEALIVAESLRQASWEEAIPGAEIERELNLLRSQFGDEKAFAKSMQSSMLSVNSLRRDLAELLRGRAWLERRIGSALGVSEDECRQFYDTQREQFVQPQRFWASHVFLAAHEDTPTEDMESKWKAIQALAARIAQGESLAHLALEASEDEATKQRGGNLGFFSASRAPTEFFAEVEKLRLGEITAPLQSHLGFHIVELRDVKPPRQLSFEEVRAEIAGMLANEKRAAAVGTLKGRLGIAEFRRPTR